MTCHACSTNQLVSLLLRVNRARVRLLCLVRLQSRNDLPELVVQDGFNERSSTFPHNVGPFKHSEFQ